MRKLILAASLVLLWSCSAYAGSSVGSVTVNKVSPLRLMTAGVTADCTWPIGTVVMSMSTTGGNGNAITYTLGGTPTGDFVISGSNLIIGPNGVAPANCGKVEIVTITVSQP